MVSISEGRPSFNKNRAGKSKHLMALFGILALLLSLPITRVEAAPASVTPGCGAAAGQTIDFSIPGEGLFRPSFFKRQGLVFTDGEFVGFFQGDQALDGPVAGTFHPGVCSLSLRVAPGLQGTAAYTLKAYSASGKVVGSTTVIVTQDMVDPASGPFGYFTIELTGLSQRAKAFTLENRFIRSSFPQNTLIPFGVSSITYRTR